MSSSIDFVESGDFLFHSTLYFVIIHLFIVSFLMLCKLKDRSGGHEMHIANETWHLIGPFFKFSSFSTTKSKHAFFFPSFFFNINLLWGRATGRKKGFNSVPRELLPTPYTSSTRIFCYFFCTNE